MHKPIAAFFLFSILFLSFLPASAQLKKIRFSTTSIAVTELQFRIAQMKGFYREEGLDLETLLIRGSVGMQALIGGSVDLLTQLILVKHGLTPNKDVTSIVIGTPEELATALRTGRIAACLLSPPRQLMLYREGFSRLAYSGDYLPSYPSGGVGATEEKIKNNPAEVLSFVRASLKGLQYYSQHRAESIDIISKYLGVKDLTLAGEVYDQIGRAHA